MAELSSVEHSVHISRSPAVTQELFPEQLGSVEILCIELLNTMLSRIDPRFQSVEMSCHSHWENMLFNTTPWSGEYPVQSPTTHLFSPIPIIYVRTFVNKCHHTSLWNSILVRFSERHTRMNLWQKNRRPQV